MGDYQRSPLNASPYMVLTCFDELVETKGIALMRGDLISHLDEDEGATIMKKLMETYLIESEFETVKMFNNEPDKFVY